ncbi:TetR/AcrR family transcriptional regulator C-terminal domain-containing protein [Dactylosporangium aurantiacum]|uniref:TetR/AcrR family transcriptional regulator C-terminal domain-containing protein n=1 Tax=Dactylosporangium aurantiacum TaxID=35754 RepID=A0A9Q9ID22_9ACTN|nr:TetR/AcrR family transcriptional regulator C-terminal domain-containing protein [Dactylosporangium aurantiacum]MDG6107889.1 TetR/AcrR family transcriptional regulator C-terminal domain-containing protein [Dactylosporangium aurantiacum]UWZ51802.1 TetR/AcrR family transcriptional regulator C-terminal domain-containing protein [Dactylosporangium aurantiacum]
MAQQVDTARRAPLTRDLVLRAAVELADGTGIDALSMRKLAQALGVVPMALYKHVTNKEELLDGMLDVVVGEIDPPAAGEDWQRAVRQRILSARRALLRHPWASRVLESRTAPTPVVLAYLDSMMGMFRAGGFSVDLTHHVMHAMGSRIMGFSQELFGAPAAGGQDAAQDVDPETARQLAARLPYITEITTRVAHDDASVVGSGCDDQFEFEFSLDLLLDGFERLRREGWTSR